MNLKKLTLSAIVLLLSLVISNNAFATVWWVDSQYGLNGYNGFSATPGSPTPADGPKLTISNVLGNPTLQNGDIINVVARGATAPYNLEPGNLLTFTKSVTINIVDAGSGAYNPVAPPPVWGHAIIFASVVINDPAAVGVTFNAPATNTTPNLRFAIQPTFNFTLTLGSVAGANFVRFDGNAGGVNPPANLHVITRTKNSTQFLAAPEMPNANSVSLVYLDDPAGNVTVGPEWTSTTAIYNVTSNQTGGRQLILAGNRTMNGAFTSTAGGVITLAGFTLTINNTINTTHANPANITSTAIGTGLLKFTGGGNYTWNGAGNIPNFQKSGPGVFVAANTPDIVGNVTVDAFAGNCTFTAATNVRGGILHQGSGTLAFGAATVTVGTAPTQYNIVNSGIGVLTTNNLVVVNGNLTNSNYGTVTVNGNLNITGNVNNVGTVSSAGGNVTVTGTSTITGNILNQPTCTATGGVMTFTGAVNITGNISNLSTVTNLSNSGNIAFGNAVTTLGAGLGNVTNGSTVNLTTGTQSLSGNITFADFAHSFNGLVLNNPIVSKSGTTLTNAGSIRFANTNTNVNFIGGLTNDANVSGTATTCGRVEFTARTTGTITVGTGGSNKDLVNSVSGSTTTAGNGDIDFRNNGATTGAVIVNGNVLSSGSSVGKIIFGQGPLTVTGNMTQSKTNDGDIQVNSTGANAVSINGNLVNNGSGGADITIGIAGLTGAITIGTAGGGGQVTLDPASGSNRIDFVGGAAPLTIWGAVLRGANGTGDIQSTVTGLHDLKSTITNNATTAGADIIFPNATLQTGGSVTNTNLGGIIFGNEATTIGGGVTNSGSGTISFGAVAFNVVINGILTNSGSGTVAFFSNPNPITLGGLNVSAGTVNFAATAGSTSPVNINVIAPANNGNFVHTAGTINYGAGVRTVSVAGPTNQLTTTAVTQGGANTTLQFNGAVAQTFQLTGGTVVWPGFLTINNTFGGATGTNCWKLYGANFWVTKDVTFTDGQVVVEGVYLFIQGNFNYNNSIAESYQTTAAVASATSQEGFISMQGTVANVVTVANTGVKFQNFEVDNSVGATMGDGSVKTMVFTKIFALTQGVVTTTATTTIDFNNIPFPTIRRNVGRFASVNNVPADPADATITFTSAVNVYYINVVNLQLPGNTTGLELPGGPLQLNNLDIYPAGGATTVQIDKDIVVNGQLTIGDGKILDLNNSNVTMGQQPPLANRTTPSKITLLGNAKILDPVNGWKALEARPHRTLDDKLGVLAGFPELWLNDPNGTQIVGSGSTGNDASANIIQVDNLTVLNGSIGNTISGIRQIRGDFIVDGTGTVSSLAFVNQTGVVDYNNIVGDFIFNAGCTGGVTLGSRVQMGQRPLSSWLTLQGGTLNLGNYDFVVENWINVLNPVHTIDGSLVTINSTGGFLIFEGSTNGSLNVLGGDVTIPYLRFNLDASGNNFELRTNDVLITNTFEVVRGTLGAQVNGLFYRVFGNTATFSTNASMMGTTVPVGLELSPTTGTLTATINNPGYFQVPDLLINTTGTVLLQGTAQGINVVNGTFTHTNGLLNFGSKNILLTGTASFLRANGTYDGNGWFIWDATGTFTNGTLMVINNFEVRRNVALLTPSMMTIIQNLYLNGSVNPAIFSNGLGAPLTNYLTLGSAAPLSPLAIIPLVKVDVTNGADLTIAPVFATGTANYIFNGNNNATIDGNVSPFVAQAQGFYWPPAIPAGEVTLNLTVGANTINLNGSRTINGPLNLTIGTLNVGNTRVLSLASGIVVNRTGNAFLTTTGSGSVNAPSIVLNYNPPALVTGVEYGAPGVITTWNINTDVTINIGRTVGAVNVGPGVTVDMQAPTIATENVVVGNGSQLWLNPGPFTVQKDFTFLGTGALTDFGGTLIFGGAQNQNFNLTGPTTVMNLTIQQSTDNYVYVNGGNLTVGYPVFYNPVPPHVPAQGNLALNRGVLVMQGNNVLRLAAHNSDNTVPPVQQGYTRGGVFRSHVYGRIVKNVKYNIIPARYEYPTGDMNWYRYSAFVFRGGLLYDVDLTTMHLPTSPLGTGGLPILDGVAPGINVDWYPAFYWFVMASANLGTAVTFDVELTAENFPYLNIPGRTIADARMIRRVDGDTTGNPWRLQGTVYDNYWVVPNVTGTVANLNSQGGLSLAGARLTYGLRSNVQVASTIPNQNLVVGGAPFVRDLTSPAVFSGFIGTGQYAANSSNNGVATVGITMSAVGNVLTVTPVAAGTATITVTGTDSYNGANASTTFQVNVTAPPPTTFSVSGTLTYDNSSNTPLSGVTLNLSTTPVSTTTTDGSGNFTFTNVPNGTYTLTALTTKPWGGVNMTDALGIAMHYAAPYLTGLKLAAADVNNSGTVNNTDALQVARRYAGQITSFDKPDWLFEAVNVTVNNGNVSGVNFKGICAGDVNGSYVPTLVKISPSVGYNNEGVQKVKPKQEISIPVTVNSNSQIGAFGLRFTYPTDLMSFSGVKSSANGLIVNDNEGVLTIGWADLTGGKEPINLKAGNALITLQFKPTEKMVKGSNASIDLDADYSEIANNLGEIINPGLNIPSVEVSVPTEFALRQNYPNPFNPTTTIEYDLPENAAVKLSVFNVLGQEVLSLVNGVQTAGSYKVLVNASNLSSGMYIYKIDANYGSQRFVETRRMMLVK